VFCVCCIAAFGGFAPIDKGFGPMRRQVVFDDPSVANCRKTAASGPIVTFVWRCAKPLVDVRVSCYCVGKTKYVRIMGT
jgi:hypothetical protein